VSLLGRLGELEEIGRQLQAAPHEQISLTDPMPRDGTGAAIAARPVRMVLSPVHNHDLMINAGQDGSMQEVPAVPRTEAVGVVEAQGEGVENLVVGQRVAGGASQTWATFYLLMQQGWCQYGAVSATKRPVSCR
jgi:threonine dehydrogenase-like Zn-dependent dehydrogenase